MSSPLMQSKRGSGELHSCETPASSTYPRINHTRSEAAPERQKGHPTRNASKQLQPDENQRRGFQLNNKGFFFLTYRVTK